MVKNLIITTCLEQWNDLMLLNQKFLNKFIFRGQADASWELATSIERMVRLHTPHYVDKALPAIYESDMLSEFKWKYPLYEKSLIPHNDDNIEWLSIMQHYGAPTRLLDFTKSLYVALYMALDNSFCDSCVWAINKSFLNKQIYNLYLEEQEKDSVIPYSKLNQFIKKKANSYIGIFHSKIKKELYIITPSLCNERIRIQQGLFVMPSDITSSFKENLDSVLSSAIPIVEYLKIPIKGLLDYSYSDIGKVSQCDILLFKVIIPIEFKLQLTKLLRQMNISAETLYPGLAGMAKSLSDLRHGMNEYNE